MGWDWWAGFILGLTAAGLQHNLLIRNIRRTKQQAPPWVVWSLLRSSLFRLMCLSVLFVAAGLSGWVRMDVGIIIFAVAHLTGMIWIGSRHQRVGMADNENA